MSQRPLTTFEDFLKIIQDFNQIPIAHVSYASSYFALLQCNLVEHPIMNIWEDLNTLKFFQHGEYPPQFTSSHWDHVQQRSKCYSWRDNHLVQCLPQGNRVVPPPHEWPDLFQKVHSKFGHFGVKRIYSLFAPHYHWRCRNPNLALATKARACKNASQEGAQKSHFMLSRVQKSVRE
jgi:hypothetical protein